MAQSGRGNRNAAQNLDEEARRRGGQNSPTNFKNRPTQEVRDIGRKGGQS
ncbi:MAG TPA: KGG domain-containing protein [Vitreimonas sp.]|nr:KGG domain-containing protein [Vitreimonas sp.]